MKILKEASHTITYDWVADYDRGREYVEANAKVAAIVEREGVRAADVLVYLWEDGQESARYEAGMAMGLGLLIIAVGEHEAFFYLLANVYRVGDDEGIKPMLELIKNLRDGP